MTGVISRAASQLVVIDMQERFFEGRVDVDAARLGEVGAAAGWIAGVARALGVPTLFTEEDRDRNGRTLTSIRALADPVAPVFVKPAFGLASVPEPCSPRRADDAVGTRPGRRAARQVPPGGIEPPLQA